MQCGAGREARTAGVAGVPVNLGMYQHYMNRLRRLLCHQPPPPPPPDEPPPPPPPPPLLLELGAATPAAIPDTAVAHVRPAPPPPKPPPPPNCGPPPLHPLVELIEPLASAIPEPIRAPRVQPPPRS